MSKELIEYEEKIAHLIATSPETVLINQASLNSFIKSNTVLKEARKIIKHHTLCEFKVQKDYEGEIERCKLFNIINIKQLEESLENNKKDFLNFVKILTKVFLTENSKGSLRNDLPLYYFQHFLAVKTENTEKIQEYFDLPPRIYSGNNIPSYFLDIYQKIKQF